MVVKDIRTLREFYKSNIKKTADTNRLCHFAGREMELDGETCLGFFEMFNGEGEIDNKLATILGMAGDSQAIYEFMQNAVDADSRHFLLSLYRHEGKPYLIVLNDGEYFSLRSVISILAIGDSSKFRNPDNIGQFGVGFKLAHRLIGADNSIRELLDENKGPILYSWANSEFATLGSEKEVKVTDPQCSGFSKNAISGSNAPWLFKMVATNFPCLIADEVWDARGRQHSGLFTQEEYDALKGAATQCYKEFKDSESFSKGTMLLIPLHEGKIKNVIGEVPKGLEIAATIIGKRAGKEHVLTTIIKQEYLKPATLEVEKWSLSREETMGFLGNEQVEHAELMLLYGDPFKGNPFESKPQFYRYFPMALEQHGLRFAIHGNALSFSSARTELQESEPNKFLFGKLAAGLDARLREFAVSDTKKFENLYASIVLSERSSGGGTWKEGRAWLEAALWQPLMDVLASQIPVKGEEGMAIAKSGQAVLIKSSTLPIEKWHNGEYCWFYWDTSDESYREICLAAERKLQLRRVGLLDILVDADSTSAVNTWLQAESKHAHLFLSELNSALFEGYDRSAVWKSFGGLKLWWFGEQVYSITELATTPVLTRHLINYGPLNLAKSELHKAKIEVSLHCLDIYSGIERTIRETSQGSLPYLFNYEELNKLLSDPFKETDELAAADKQAIFRAIEQAVRDSANTIVRRIATMKPLAIFKNKGGAVLPFYELIGSSDVPEMLTAWRISEGETVGLNLGEYLSTSREDIYELVVLPHWEDITAQKATQDQRIRLFSYLADSYGLKSTMPLPESSRVFFGHDGTRNNAFYHQTLHQLQSAEHRALSKALSALGVGNLPHQSLLHFYAQAPFALRPADSLTISEDHTPLSKAEVTIFIRWAMGAFPDVCREYLFLEDEGETFIVRPRPKGVHQFASTIYAANEYAADILADILLPLPRALISVMGDAVLNGEALLRRFIHELPKNTNGLNELIQIIQEHGGDGLKHELFNLMAPIELAAPLDAESLQYQVLKLCFSINNDEQRRHALEKLAGITIKGVRTPLLAITNRGSDRLIVTHASGSEVSLSVSELLGDSNNVNHILTDAAQRWEAAGFATRDKIEDALGIHDAPPPAGVYEQMLATLEDGKLQNGAQLTFTMLMLDEKIPGSTLQVETGAGWGKLSGYFYAYSASFIPDELTLHEKYNGAAAHLLQTERQFDCGMTALLAYPYFDQHHFILPGIETIHEDAQSSFWAALFTSWQASDMPAAITINGTSDWEPLLGVDPSAWVLTEELALDVELVPKARLGEYGISGAYTEAFLLALGAHGPQSSLVQTRQYFQNAKGRVDNMLPTPQILNTLQWLQETNLEVRNEDIASFYKTLSQNVNELGLFPGNVSGEHGLRIIPLEDSVFFVSKDAISTILQKRNTLQQIADAGQITIIAAIGALQDWIVPLRAVLTDLPIRWRESDWETAEAEAAEWGAPFYRTWKASYPHLELRILRGEMPRMSTVNGMPLSRYRDGKVGISQDKNVVYIAGGFSTETILDCLDNELAFTESARAALRAAFEAQTEVFQQYISLAEKDPQFAQIIQKSAESALLREERQRISEQVQLKDNYYTLEWFQNLLDLVRVQERSSAIPELTFSRCERLPSAEHVYELSESNGRIPSNIGSFEEIPATISYRNEGGEIVQFNTKIEASPKHQKLWARFPEVRAQAVLEHPVVSVRLTFTRTVELIEELRRGYERLRMASTDNLKDTLSPNIDFLFGPPGTGKTTTLARNILTRINTGVKGPVIVLTPTNKAADVLTRKILEESGSVSHAPAWLIRAGTCTEPDLLASGAVKMQAELIVAQDSQTVLITTIHRFAYFTVLANAHSVDKVRLCDCPWSEVIFDESSMIPLAYIAYAIQARQRDNSNTHFLVAGDPLQIPPVFDLIADDLDEAEELERHNIYTMIGLQSFDEEEQQLIPVYGSRIQNLTVQHRSIKAIGELYSNFQYAGRIAHSRGTRDNKKSGKSRPLPMSLAQLGFKPVTVIRYPVRSGDSIYEVHKLKGSPIHLYTALMVSELIKKFREGIEHEKQTGWSVGVLSPYRSQADVLQKMIEGHQNQNSAIPISIDTVHGFQGDENTLVFAVFNPGNVNVNYSRFLHKEFILNVAISRAEDYLVMLVPDDESKGMHKLNLLQELLALVKDLPNNMYAVLDATELEAGLMGQQRYFERNSFSSAHQKVNVYGQPQLPYMIRLGEESLDVHWKNDKLGSH